MSLGNLLLILFLLMNLVSLSMILNSLIMKREFMLIFCSLLGISLVFLLLDCRTPDNCSVKQKVIYSSSKRAFQSKLVGSKMIDAFDADDLREETIISKLM